METTTTRGEFVLRLAPNDECRFSVHHTGGQAASGTYSRRGTSSASGARRRPSTPCFRGNGVLVLLGGVALFAGLLAPIGCNRDVRLEGTDLRDVTVKTVTHYGTTLDENATPQDVTYVLLRAIRDDFLAKDEAARLEAINTQKDLCAVDSIVQRSLPTLNRAEAIHHTVYRWTPIVSHYVSSLEFDREAAEKRFVLIGPAKAKGGEFLASQVRLELEDPNGDAKARVVLAVDLIQENKYWRVLRLSYPSKRSIRATAVEPATSSAHSTELSKS